MEIDKIKIAYRRNLPHIQPVGACFFVTFRLKDSVPKVKLYELRQAFEANINRLKNGTSSVFLQQEIYNLQKQFFGQYDQLLDTIQNGPHFLKQNNIAAIVANQIHRFDDELYNLLAYCIMSNHVHLLIDTSIQLPEKIDVFNFGQIDFEPLQNIMKRIKGASARYINLEMDRKGSFWQQESYDHYIRDAQELNNVINYILNNPVKAGLVQAWQDYSFTYLKT